jgi:hypothetical protein
LRLCRNRAAIGPQIPSIDVDRPARHDEEGAPDERIGVRQASCSAFIPS